MFYSITIKVFQTHTYIFIEVKNLTWHLVSEFNCLTCRAATKDNFHCSLIYYIIFLIKGLVAWYTKCQKILKNVDKRLPMSVQADHLKCPVLFSIQRYSVKCHRRLKRRKYSREYSHLRGRKNDSNRMTNYWNCWWPTTLTFLQWKPLKSYNQE